jgi:small subunit ribosomal protein S2
MPVLSMKQLLETGVHFGHRTRKWNPRMKPYIFTERNRIHIIDLQRTLKALDIAYELVRDTVAERGTVLFVGTKRQAQETIETEAERCGMPYVNMRWLGGTLTNWRTIHGRIEELETLERRQAAGEFEHLTKKEALLLQRKIERLDERLGGIREMHKLPNLLFVVDVRREETAVHEANLLEIPVVALVDTNCDPRGIDYIIPSNDDAIRAIKLLTGKIADAVLEGAALRKDEEIPEAERDVVEAEMALEMPDEELLGEATLAKLKSGEYGEETGEEEKLAEGEPAEEPAEGKKEEEEPVEELPSEEPVEASAEAKDAAEEKKPKPSTKKTPRKKKAEEPVEEQPSEEPVEASADLKDEGEEKKPKPAKKKTTRRKKEEESAEELPTEGKAEASEEPKDEGKKKPKKSSRKKSEPKKE